MLDVQAPVVPLVADLIRRHPGTISLGQGVVHYAPPPQVGQAVAAAVAADPRVDRYGLAFGTDDLLAAARAKLAAENGTVVGDAGATTTAATPTAPTTAAARRVVVTTGSNMAFLTAVLAVADVGDEVILLSPYYFNHEMAIGIAGCRAVVVPTDADYQPRLDAIAAAVTPRTRAVVTVSPNNPTGAVYPEATLRAINSLCRDRGVYHLHDEAYEYFVYPASGSPAGSAHPAVGSPVRHFSPVSIAGSDPHTVAFYTLSKAYGMAGWRVGYMVIPGHLADAVRKVQDTNLICPPIATQVAATAALAAGRAWVDAHTADFPAVRDLVAAELAALGDRVRVPPTGGALYALLRVNVRRTGQTDVGLVEALIRDHGVAVLPGGTFGMTDGCYLRVAFGALAPATVAAGMGRLVRGLRTLV
jgi:aspartate/methionine/tyrosine aminotransferase